jgi:hypothetical protein
MPLSAPFVTIYALDEIVNSDLKRKTPETNPDADTK